MKLRNVEKSRKRRRFQLVKKYIIAAVISCLLLIISFLVWYFFVYRNLPLYTSPLPIMKSLQNLTIADVVQKQRLIERELVKRNIAYSRIDTSESSAYSITLKGGGEVILVSDKDIVEQIASLQVILNRLTMEGRQFKRLDLRFDKPVIVF